MTKRISVVLVLAIALVLVSATAAYAAAVSGYAAWSTTAGGNGATAATPHKEYTTTTVKCAVCHAVHKATAGGQLLLRGSAGTSCQFCHIDDNIGLVRIYDGDGDNYTFGSSEAHTNNAAGVQVGSRCTDCHAIHGANTMDNAKVAKFILKTTTAASGGPGGVSSQQANATARATANPTLKEYQIDAFCTMCHPYYQPNYASGGGTGEITVNTYSASGDVQPGGAVPANYQSHIMGAANPAYTNAAKSIGNIRVAWLPSTNCRSCHDAGETDTQGLPANQPIDPAYVAGSGVASIITNSYPHYTPDYTRFMSSGGVSSAGATGTLSYTTPDGPGNNNYNSNSLPDGACLKCHRGAVSTSGVGYDF